MMFRGIAILCVVTQGIVPWGMCLCAAAGAEESLSSSSCCSTSIPVEPRPNPSSCYRCHASESEGEPSPTCPCVSKRGAEQPFLVRLQRLLPDGYTSGYILNEVRGLEAALAGCPDFLDAPWSWPWATHAARQALLAVWLK